MKKTTILSLVAAAVFSCVPASSLVPVLAAGQKQAQTATVSRAAMSAEDFCSKYAGHRIQTVNKDKTVTETFVYFDKADESNMSQILEGSKVYVTLPEATRKEIDEKLKKEGCDFASLVKAASVLEQKEEEKDAQKPVSSAETSDKEQTKKPEAADEAKDQPASDKTEPAKESGSAENQTSGNKTSETEKTEVTDPVQDAEEQTPAQGSEEQSTPADNILFSNTLEGEGSLSGQKITITLKADKSEPSEEGLAQALKHTAENELSMSNPVLYTNAAYKAECGTNSAVLEGLHAAAGENGDLHVFQASYDEAKKAWLIQELSGSSYSFDFVSQNFTLPVKASWSYDFEKSPVIQNDPVQNEAVQAPAEAEEKKESADEDHNAQADTPQKPDTQQPVTQQPAETAAEAQAAETFVKTHCSDANGKVFTGADQSNYQAILAGFDDWRELSNAQKKKVNELLAAGNAPTFQVLYRQANQIRLGVPSTEEQPAKTPSKTDTPATASGDFELVYLSGAALSLCGIFVSAFRGRKVRKA